MAGELDGVKGLGNVKSCSTKERFFSPGPLRAEQSLSFYFFQANRTMSGRINPLYGKRRSQKKKPGAKPNATRQRQLALRRKKHMRSALYAKQQAAKAEAAEKA